jgi:carbon-monoxide dehydrogenase iron sulfur subunit
VVRRQRSVALKCDHCIDRQELGQIPACVEVCKVGALVFGDLNELTRSSSARLARLVSAATGQIQPELPSLPTHFEAWRAWGEQTSKMNEG